MCSFVASAAVAHGIIVFLKKSISYFMTIMYKHIFLNFGVISFINKEMVSLFQLHTYKFGLVYNTTKKLMGKFKKNVTIQFFYLHALSFQYFYLHLLFKINVYFNTLNNLLPNLKKIK